MNIQPELKKPPHWYEPSNGTMYAMICCRDHHEYSTWTKKTPHWYEPFNGTMYAMVCCRGHHEY